MNCGDIHDRIGDALDRHLPDALKDAFFRHLELCRPCRTDYELELLAKRAVRRAVPRKATPADVYSSVLNSLRRDERTRPAPGTWLDRLLTGRILGAALAGGVAVVAITFFLSVPRQAPDEPVLHTADNDIIQQTISNFGLVRSGDLKPAMVSCYPELVAGFFERNDVRFTVNVVPLENCDWYGAISNEFGGVKLAHVMYKIGDEMLYVYQVNKEDALRGTTLALPAAAMRSLAETGWYTDPDHPDCNVVVWTDDGTLCAAVSTMKKDRLLALLSSGR